MLIELNILDFMLELLTWERKNNKINDQEKG